MNIFVLIIFFASVVALVILFSRNGGFAKRGLGRARAMNLPADAQSAFLVCTFSMLGKLAEADGQVSKDEEEKVKQYAEERLLLDTKTKALALKVFKDAVSSPLQLRDYAEKFRSTYPDRVQLLDRMVEILVEVSAADGVLAPREEELARSAALLLGLTEAGYERIKKKCGVEAVLVH